MIYKFKFNGFLFTWQFWYLLGMFCWSIIRGIWFHDYYFAGYILLMVFTFLLPGFIKRVKFWRTKEPALTVNDYFVEDHFRNRQYFWKDIKEIVSDARFLRVELYDLQPYIDRYRKPNALQRKWPKIFRRSKIFAIDIINLKIENEETLLDTLDDYSEKALELESNLKTSP